jgi:aminoglycoside phosphotransferase family enzyme
VEGERLQLFDCLQFEPRFRCADVAAEVAFLAMDLEQFGRADLAATFADEYVRASGDDELFRLLDFSVCYRAYVRGKVRSLRLAQTSPRSSEGEELVEESRSYFDLALAHSKAGQPLHSWS